ncbi:hypothetical protein llap_8243 [Limosa lapponica baueri]|uniref:Uncharacterized protein n=1 Tax=Limosa lapponica baueri TaxID=1758121 RepID=A0A2I0U608_LIMLA|nr:hypothetical protein llap_8243 [Limosa lapponica baueri]
MSPQLREHLLPLGSQKGVAVLDFAWLFLSEAVTKSQFWCFHYLRHLTEGWWVCKGWQVAGEALSHGSSDFAGIWRREVVESTEEEDEDGKETEMVHMHKCCLSW